MYRQETSSGDLKSSRTLLQTLRVHTRTCTGSTTAPPHFDITRNPTTKFWFDLTLPLHRQYKGNVAAWFQHDVTANPIPDACPCWRKGNGTRPCRGTASTAEIWISLPEVLIINVGDQDLDHPVIWNFPIQLHPSTAKEMKQHGVVYEIIGRALHNPSSQHFIARFRDHTGNIFTYDGMKNLGDAWQETEGTLKTHLEGGSINAPSGFVTYTVFYRLMGGKEAQDWFQKDRWASLARIHHLEAKYNDGEGLVEITSTRSNVSPVSKDDCDWLPTGRSYHNKQEYIFLQDPTNSTPPPPSSTKPPSVTTSDFPFHCRCGISGDGNIISNSLPAIQCHECENWSHISCQRAGRASGLAKKAKFQCDDCLPLQRMPPQRRGHKKSAVAVSKRLRYVNDI